MAWNMWDLVVVAWSVALIMRGVGGRHELGEPIRLAAKARPSTYGGCRPRSLHQFRSPRQGRATQHYVSHPRDVGTRDVLGRQGGEDR